MSQGGRDQRPGAWVLSRRQLLGGGVLGATGLAVASITSNPLAAGATVAPSGRPGPPDALRVDGLATPIGLGPDDVFFAWRVTDSRRGARQQAYRVQVSGPVSSTSGAPLVWDSGRVVSADQLVPYAGAPLSTDAAYRWTVQTWDGEGGAGPRSAPSVFETGLAEDAWSAEWITRDTTVQAEPDQYTYARTEVELPAGAVARARAFVSGDQQYELYLNGVRAGKGQAYSYPDSMYYETLNVTALVRPGTANAVGITTSWQGPTKGHPAGRPGTIAQIVVHYENGHRRTIATDGSWRVRKGAWLPGTQRDLEGDLVDFTEHVDGPSEPVGWQSPGFDDSSWAPAVVLGRATHAPWTHLVPVRTRIVEEPVAAQMLTTLASGAVVADFGKVYAAVPTVSFHRGVAGRTVSMHAGYLLDEPVPGQAFTGVPGQVSTQHGTQHTDMSYQYIQRGGEETFHPFDYLGFRYLQIDDPGETLEPADVVALTRHTAPPEDAPGTFTSSEPLIDAEFQLGLHSALFTAQEQFIDTPTREKGSWLFDGFNESCTAMAGLGEQNLTRKSLLEFAQSQRRYWPNGAVNKIYPTGLGALDINESTEIYPEWVWQYWMHTGDRELLDHLYPVVARISDYVHRAVDPRSGLVTDLPATNVYYLLPVVTRLNVLGANVFRRAAGMAEALGRPDSETALQRGRQSRLTSAINRRLTRPDGTYIDGLLVDGSPVTSASQTANACAAAYGVVPAARLSAVARLVSRLGIQAPPQTAAEVLATLALAGRYDDLVARLVDATSDGWANILARGATFTWEVWNPSDVIGDSMSHGWGSNVSVQIQRTLLGVRPTGPGYAGFDVVPPTSGLARAAGTVPTPRGTIVVAWSQPGAGDPRFLLNVTVPPNSTALVTLPATRTPAVTESGRPADRAPGVRPLGAGNGTADFAVGSGSFRFASTTS